MNTVKAKTAAEKFVEGVGLVDTVPVCLGKGIQAETDSNGIVTIHLPARRMSSIVCKALQNLTETLWQDGFMSERKAELFVDKVGFKLHQQSVIDAMIETVKDNNRGF